MYVAQTMWRVGCIRNCAMPVKRSFVLSVIWQAAYVNTFGVETVHCVAWNSADLFCRPCPAELSWSVNHAVHI